MLAETKIKHLNVEGGDHYEETQNEEGGQERQSDEKESDEAQACAPRKTEGR